MKKSEFYKDKQIIAIEWWISWCSEYPDLILARIRIFTDNTVDITFDEVDKLKIYGFDAREYASLFLCEDEFMPIDSMDDEDEADIGIKRANISIPSWTDNDNFEFKYLGVYP